MRRSIWAYILVLGLLGVFGSLTWLTRNPDAEILRRAENWPVVGKLAVRFQQAYRASYKTEREDSEAFDASSEMTDLDRIAEAIPSPPSPVFAQHVWVLPGMELKSRASADAPTVFQFEKLSRAGKVENRGDWYSVDYHGREGWVHLRNYDEDAEIPYGEEPEPVGPVAPQVPEETLLAATRKYLRGGERVSRLGPYALYTDSSDDELIAFLDAVVENVEAAYIKHYDRQPIGEPSEAVVLFQSDIAYRLLQRKSQRIAGLAAAGHSTKGVAALYIGSRSRSEVASTVVHELVHFINRRAVGPQLPPWLDEGLADALAQGRIDDTGALFPQDLGGRRLVRRNEYRFEGGFANLWRLRESLQTGELPAVPALMSTDWQDFVRTPKVKIHYAAASFWIRYLMGGENGRYAAAFRSFLDEVAGGAPPTTTTLRTQLGEDWSVINARFRAWIEHRAEVERLPASTN